MRYLLNIELGKAIDTSFCHGKIREKSTYEHLKGQPLLDKALASIRSSHQRDAFRQAGVCASIIVHLPPFQKTTTFSNEKVVIVLCF